MKKTKFMTKVMAVVFALAILFAMSVPAFAETEDGAMVIAGNTTNITSNTVPIKKAIVFENSNTCNVYEPNIVYTYRIAAFDIGSTDVTVEDQDHDVAHVKSGVPAAITTATTTITFNNSNPVVNVNGTNGAVREQGGSFTFDPSQFPSAGIYRYVITEESTNPSKADVGIVQGSDFVDTRYMDVYVKNTGTNTREVYAAVIFTSTTTGITPGTDSLTPSFDDKTTGFGTETGDGTGTIDYTSDQRADHYKTYNFEVKKEVDGNLADQTHKFPFYVQVSNSINGAAISYTKIGNESIGATVDGTIQDKYTLNGANFTVGTNGSNSNLTLKHGESIVFTGVPSATSDLSVVITEWNDTVDKYTPTASATRGTLTMSSTNASQGTEMAAKNGATIVSDSTISFDIVNNDTAGQILKITNAITEISPTGLVFRVAPYVLMLLAGVSLVLLFAKRRREVTDMI